MISVINSSNNPNFGIMISRKTVQKANRTCIERSKLAKLEGLTLAEYRALHREDYVQKIGNKTFDFYAMAEEIMSNKEKVKKAFSNAWKTIFKNK